MDKQKENNLLTLFQQQTLPPTNLRPNIEETPVKQFTSYNDDFSGGDISDGYFTSSNKSHNSYNYLNSLTSPATVRQ